MRAKLLVILILYAGFARADWTGVALELADIDADWKFDDGSREARVGGITFEIEERTGTGLSVGAGIGYINLRVAGDSGINTRKFDAEYLKVYLRQEITITSRFSLHGLFNYSYFTGSDDDQEDSADIDWSEAGFEIDASFRFANFRLSPFAAYHDVDGDISDDSGTAVFDLDDPVSRGIRLDYYLEPSAFIRFVIQSGGRAGGYLSFVRRY